MVNPQTYYPPPQQQNGNLAYLPTVYPPQYYPYSQPTPQPDPLGLDQLAKTVRLLDYIRGKDGSTQASSPAQALPSQQQVSQFGTPGAGSTAQFMPRSQADIDRQYQEMASIQQSGQSTQTNSQPWQQVWGQTQTQASPTITNSLEFQQKQVINQLVDTLVSLDNEIGMWVNLSGNLVHIMEINLMLNQEIELLDKLVFSLLPFVQAAQIWAKDSMEHEAVLSSVLNLLLNPGYLVYHAFEMWKQMPLTNFDLDVISEQFLQLLQIQKPQQVNQQQLTPLSPLFTPQQQMPVPFPPVPSQTSNQGNGMGIYAVIDALRNPQGSDTAKGLIRARNAGLI